MISVTLNNLPCVAITPELAAELANIGEDAGSLNTLQWPAGVSAFAEGVFLMDKANADALKADRSSAVTVKLTDDLSGTTSDYIVTANRLWQLPHRPIHLQPIGTRATAGYWDGLYAVRLVDDRYWLKEATVSTSQSYNVTLPESRSDYFTSTLNGGTAFTWSGLITGLISDLGLSGQVTVNSTGSTVGGTPADFLMEGDGAAAMLDRVLATLGLVFYAGWGSSNSWGSTRYLIDTPTALASSVSALMAARLNDYMSGGPQYDMAGADSDAVGWLDVVMPSSVAIYFPRQPGTNSNAAGNIYSPTLNQYYRVNSTNGKPTGSTGRASYSINVFDNTWALGEVGAETNAAALQTRADTLAASYYARWQITKTQTRHRGFHNVGPFPGLIRWSLTPAGPFTVVSVPDNWWEYGGNRDILEGFRNRRVVGLGGIRTARTYDGSLLIYDNPARHDSFVRVKQNGGSNGDGTAYATYTYDCYDFADTSCTGTAMSGGPFAVLNGGTTSYSSGSAARIAPWGVNVAPTGSPAELVTLPSGTKQLRNVGETVQTKACGTNTVQAYTGDATLGSNVFAANARNPLTLTLASPSAVSGKPIIITADVAATGSVFLASASGINGASSWEMRPGDSVTLLSDGSTYRIT